MVSTSIIAGNVATFLQKASGGYVEELYPVTEPVMQIAERAPCTILRPHLVTRHGEDMRENWFDRGLIFRNDYEAAVIQWSLGAATDAQVLTPIPKHLIDPHFAWTGAATRLYVSDIFTDNMGRSFYAFSVPMYVVGYIRNAENYKFDLNNRFWRWFTQQYNVLWAHNLTLEQTEKLAQVDFPAYCWSDIPLLVRQPVKFFELEFRRAVAAMMATPFGKAFVVRDLRVTSIWPSTPLHFHDVSTLYAPGNGVIGIPSRQCVQVMPDVIQMLLEMCTMYMPEEPRVYTAEVPFTQSMLAGSLPGYHTMFVSHYAPTILELSEVVFLQGRGPLIPADTHCSAAVDAMCSRFLDGCIWSGPIQGIHAL
jgi:hypothetical protein